MSLESLKEAVENLEARVEALEKIVHGGTEPFRTAFARKLRDWAEELEDEDLTPAPRFDPREEE